MANHKSALKRARQSEGKRLQNKAYKTKVKNIVKQVRTAAAEEPVDIAKEKLQTAVSVLQKTASKGVIHKNQAARKISRLTRLVNKKAAA